MLLSDHQPSGKPEKTDHASPRVVTVPILTRGTKKIPGNQELIYVWNCEVKIICLI